ncbi:MAG TPA: hypothetical protein PKL56_11620 [Cyclobacteriaceae bacterium]|nr:hypothetical protein [Cyclobacteriaceae bacterium]HMV07442.1 hypothetical protein [Cyclobacteriaceae bacterium]HMW99203.1 hypothetical protein [Cyclobacteriaceae bacterium]HMX48164.1 hypothetical protein [Cyclobacteriaceae bacterium]HMY94969.1 hypothetical protein [Cyclobacteriaceae bacterium]
MRSIKGGVEDGGSGTCGFSVNVSGVQVVGCNVTKAQAQQNVANYGGHWCCDSCPTTSYCGNGGPA